MLNIMSAESNSSFDAFYGIEKKIDSDNISFEKCDLSPYSTEDKDSSELCHHTCHRSKVAETSSVELLYVRRSRIEHSKDSCSFNKNSAQSSTSEKDSSYYEALDFNSDKSESSPAKDEFNMSDNDRDSDDDVQSYHEAPVKSIRKRIISEPPKKKTTETLKRKVRTVQPKTKLNKSKQEAKNKYVAAEQNAEYVTQKLLAARKEKINELRNEMVDLQRQHKNLEDENKILRRINARQQRELNKIEESRDELPELVKAHTEEIRVMKSLLRQSRDKYRDLEQRMKVKDSELQKKKEELQKVRLLTKNTDLLERSTLHEKVESLEKLMQERENTIMELTRKLELLDKNYKRDIMAEKTRQKELLNEMKNLQKDYDKLQLSLSLKEKKIEQQNIYCNLRKPSSNISQVLHSSYPENKQISAEGETPKQASNVSSTGSIKDKHSVKNLSKEKCDSNLINWHQKTPSNISKRLFSTPLTESREVHSEYEKMASFLSQSSPATEQSMGLSNVNSECERPRFEKRLDPKTKERLLSHLKSLDISDKEFSSFKEDSSHSDPSKRLSASICVPDSVDNLIFSSYVPSIGESSRHSIISNIQNSNQTLGSHSVFGSSSFNISSLNKSHSKQKDKNELKVNMDSFDEKVGLRGPGLASRYRFSDECSSSSNAGGQSSDRPTVFSLNADGTANSHR